MTAEYDDFADIYDVWVGTASVTRQNLEFYRDLYLQEQGAAVELGVGNGRILIAAAQKGKPVTGVDSSEAMLELCRRRTEEAGVASLVTLLPGDFRDFQLPELAALITIPFHSICHLLTAEDQAAAFRQIWSQLAPGGRLVFDHFIFDTAAAARNDGQTRLRAEYRDPATGKESLLWVYHQYDLAAQTIRLTAWTDLLEDGGEVISRRYRRLSLSWMHPEQTKRLLEDAGFTIEAVHGDFGGSPLSMHSPEQIWFCRRR